MIGPTIKIKGEVTGDENLVIEGKVEGTINLKSNDVTIGQSGHINADVVAKVIKIDGEVQGDITGQEKVIVSKSGNVCGNIVAPRVTLEDGAKFKGSIDMDPAGGKKAEVPLTAVTSTPRPQGSPSTSSGPMANAKSG